jgi:glutaredoxin 3
MSEKKTYPKVIAFSTPTWSFCKKAKQYLRHNNVPFKDVDVSKDDTTARDVERHSGQRGVPVLVIGSKIVVGFDRPAIDCLLNIKQ